MSLARNLAGFGNSANVSGFAPAVATSSGFIIQETGGKLVFKYGANTIGTLDISGNFTANANVQANSTIVSIGDVIGFGP
jgi:hypothetical protein